VKAVVFRGARSLSVEEVSEPRIEQPGDAIVRVRLSGISGSNVRAYTGEWQRDPGNVIGFEFMGEVVETGPGVTRLKQGQRVVGPFSVHCGGCFYCKQGLLTACEKRLSFGRDLPGTHAEYVRVPRADAVLEPVPDAVSDMQALFVSDSLPGPFAGLQMAGLKAGESVVVLGCGPTGLCAQLLARVSGAARFIAVDHHDYRLGTAAELGAITVNFDREDAVARVQQLTQRGADLVVEAVGRAGALSEAVALVRPWGRILSLGDGIETEAIFPVGTLTRKHATLIPAGVPPIKNSMRSLLRMLERGVLDPTPIATHVLPLSDAPRAYELMANREEGALKVVLQP
jgi:threonine dehydrogenase-like Zn-dependent dehydrogenase